MLIQFHKGQDGLWKISRGLQAFILFSFLFWSITPCAVANPSGEQVVAGTASFQRTANGTILNINTSDRVVINWQDFSIGGGELTQFNQPSASSMALNRVITGNPSAIYGTLRANGNVFLTNPNGIFIGPSGLVDTGGFVASTLDVLPDDFMTGGDMDFSGTSTSSIINQGNIQTLSDDVILIARHIENKGSIASSGGAVRMAAGSEVLLAEVEDADKRLFVRARTGDDGTILNEGTIEGVKAEFTASNENPYALAIQNNGTVRATGAIKEGGKVFLTSKTSGVINRGTITAHAASDPDVVDGKITQESMPEIILDAERVVTTETSDIRTKDAPGDILIYAATVSIDGILLNERGGTLLIDPQFVIIDDGTGGMDLNTSYIDAETIATALDSSTDPLGPIFPVDAFSTTTNDVIIEASQSITVGAAITATTGNANLYLKDQDDNNSLIVNLNDAITLNGTGVLTGDATTVNLDTDGLFQNAVDILDSNATTVTINAAANPYGEAVTISRDVTINSTGTIGLNSLTADNDVTLGADVTTTGAQTYTGLVRLSMSADL
ncbi:MAG: filamentous hemagglutinin N-terminal domain-containing protein, partial [Verrucomicrobiota bacterium]